MINSDRVKVCWIPILKSKKLILAGDPMQLPPTILSMNDKNTTGSTVSMKGSTTTAVQTKKRGASQSKKQPAQVVEPTNETKKESSDAEDDGNVSEATSSKTAYRLRPSPTLEVTLFERVEKMYGSRIKRMLTVQYR